MLHLCLDLAARIKVRAGLAGQPGVKFFQVNAAMRHFGDAVDSVMATTDFKMPAGFVLDDEAVTATVAALAAPVAEGTVGAFGDGSIIQAIKDWLNSPEGKAFIAALLQALLAILMGL